MNLRQIISIAAGALLILVALIVVSGSWYTIDQGQRGVLLTNGAYTETVGPGLHFKTPWFQSVVKLSTQQQVVYWNCPPGAQGCSSEQRTEMQAYSRDQQPANMRVTVNYHVPEAEVANVYANYGTVEALADRVIARKAPQEVKTIFGQYDAVSVIQNRAKFNAQVSKAVADVVDGPVVVDSVQIENIDFSDAYENAVEARMTAQVEVQKQEQTLQQEKIKADIAVTQAEGRAKSVKAEADAKAYATKVQGDAEADAIKARAGALSNNPLLVELTKAEKWNGTLPTSMIPGSAVPFLSVQ
ncbi:prohibitin family protein [Mesorhizobium silamurunense]|uniref:prohibitin family protein n=1 Tax=Mesorhizobium silamurunense TaxID=499528 RepID=UPI00177E4CCB|nr:prohibitin family protein [Mesorhizobium silamurunense]